MSITELAETDEQDIRNLLLGRRIVSAERGSFEPPGLASYRSDRATGKLTLDNGTEVFVVPNTGGCSCGAGDYELEKLAAVDNIITDVRFAVDVTGQEPWETSQAYRVYVVADATEINVLSVEGDDGNGYYGTGYELFVVGAS